MKFLGLNNMSDFISGFFSWGVSKKVENIKTKREPKSSKFNERIALLKAQEPEIETKEIEEVVVKEKYKLHKNLRPNFTKKLKQKEVIEDEE